MTSRIDYSEEYYQRREYSPTFRAEIRAILDVLDPQETDVYLELGCGSGVLLSKLVQAGCRNVIGLDWLPTSVNLSLRQSTTDSNLLYGDASRLPIQAGSIDKLAAQHLIEHFRDTQQVLLEWNRVLRAGGKLVLVTPNLLFPHQHWFDDPTHEHIFTIDELAKCVEQAGFHIDKAQIVNPYVIHWRFNGFVARYLQFLNRVPYVGTRGMSILLSATKV